MQGMTQYHIPYGIAIPYAGCDPIPCTLEAPSTHGKPDGLCRLPAGAMSHPLQARCPTHSRRDVPPTFRENNSPSPGSTTCMRVVGEVWARAVKRGQA
eukprot:230463-Chlamydomonas_euryale.AAC.1